MPAAPTPPSVFVKGLEPHRPAAGLRYSAPSVDGGAEPEASYQGAGGGLPGASDEARGGGPARNAPCPCGSGRKYKRCHGDPARRG
jgi:preprotein translocase subunit SecA